MKTKYDILINILERLNKEAPKEYKTYHRTDDEGRNHALGLALIHLFLKSKFGLMTFEERIRLITDGSGDGGIDAYFIDDQIKEIFVIQSKFRCTESNFCGKIIDANELAAVQLNRITKGEKADQNGLKYNGKIEAFQRIISSIQDIGRYNYKVIILANIGNLKKATLQRLIDGFPYEAYNFNRIYNEVLFPFCSGLYFDPDSITLEIETSEKERSEFNQSINTRFGEFSVRILFVPALELARHVLRYRNSLLKYNPRNFLSFSKNPVNDNIRESIISERTNLFALLNNGITFVAASDSFTDRTGKKGKGRLTIIKPQIINGGQTAYALAKILEDQHAEELSSKSVLVKIITPTEDQEISNDLIEMVSFANNRQSKIVEADQRSNSSILMEIQKYLFEKQNLFFERKRGEFFESITSKYLPRESIVNRVEFVKSVIAFLGEIAKARTSQDVIFEESSFQEIFKLPSPMLMSLAYLSRRKLSLLGKKFPSPFPVLGAFGCCIDPSKVTNDNISKIADQILSIHDVWSVFETWATQQPANRKYVVRDRLNDNYYKGKTIDQDIKKYFTENPIDIDYA